MAHLWHTRVGDNPEQRPYLIDHRSQWARGNDVYASDGDSLGSVAGVMRIDFDHSPGRIMAPEHGILSYWLCLRWPPIFQYASNPLLDGDGFHISDWTAGPCNAGYP